MNIAIVAVAGHVVNFCFAILIRGIWGADLIVLPVMMDIICNLYMLIMPMVFSLLTMCVGPTVPQIVHRVRTVQHAQAVMTATS